MESLIRINLIKKLNIIKSDNIQLKEQQKSKLKFMKCIKKNIDKSYSNTRIVDFQRNILTKQLELDEINEQIKSNIISIDELEKEIKKFD
jgi:hypothetical protein